MKFIIPGLHFRVLGKAILALAKIGDELYIEPVEDKLTFRTVNLARSAYCCFEFKNDFFEVFDMSPKLPDVDNESDDDSLKFKVNMKSCLIVFKSLSTMERRIESCKMTINSKYTRLVFQLLLKFGIAKTYYLPFIESETMQAIFSRNTPNKFSSPHTLFTELLHSFQPTQEEITLTANSEKINVKNYNEDDVDKNKVINTDVNFASDEFDTFDIGEEVNVTFCFKELRAFISFTEVGSMDISVHFEKPGRPIIFSLSYGDLLEGSLVLATLAQGNDNVSMYKVPAQASAQRAEPAAKKRRTAAKNDKVLPRKWTQNKQPESKRPQAKPNNHNISENRQPQAIPGPSRQYVSHNTLKDLEKLNARKNLDTCSEDTNDDTIPASPLTATTKDVSRCFTLLGSTPKANNCEVVLVTDSEDDDDNNREIELVKELSLATTRNSLNSNHSNNTVSFVGKKTPVSKEYKSFLFATPETNTGSDEVLASDTDDEDD